VCADYDGDGDGPLSPTTDLTCSTRIAATAAS
jgi:hypothetical protein